MSASNININHHQAHDISPHITKQYADNNDSDLFSEVTVETFPRETTALLPALGSEQSGSEHSQQTVMKWQVLSLLAFQHTSRFIQNIDDMSRRTDTSYSTFGDRVAEFAFALYL
jgi:hypothetical protein